jgi:aldehyde dehydrogenase (NAD+)
MTPPQVETTPNPSTDIATIPPLVEALRASFEAGTTRPVLWRKGQLDQIARLMNDHADDFLGALKADLGKPALEAQLTDISIVKNEAMLAKKHLARWMRPQKIRTPLEQHPASARILREPLGVVLIIAPWNYPIQLLLSPLVGAIAAGNCVVLKPSEVTPHVSELLGRLVPRYLDTSCVALVQGGVDETSVLLKQRFDHILYTGNGGVGRVVMEAAAHHLTPVTLELGGKSPCIVDREVDIEVSARRIAWGKFLNAGQTCIAPDYVLVHESREAELLDALKRALREFYGEDPKRSKDFGRIVNERHHRRLAVLLKDGEIVVGGEVDEAERYIAPTILRNVSSQAPVMNDEIFGPILPVLTIRDIDEAIRFVNARPKPLALYVFTRDPKVEDAVLSHTSSGGACVNATLWHLANSNLPFGGVGPSGMGAYHGRDSFETFSHRKSVVTKSTRLDPKIAYPPYTRLKTQILKRLL